MGVCDNSYWTMYSWIPINVLCADVLRCLGKPCKRVLPVLAQRLHSTTLPGKVKSMRLQCIFTWTKFATIIAAKAFRLNMFGFYMLSDISFTPTDVSAIKTTPPKSSRYIVFFNHLRLDNSWKYLFQNSKLQQSKFTFIIELTTMIASNMNL